MHFKLVPSFLILLFCATVFGQNATEIYLFDLVKTEDSYVLKNPINISNNKGFDNQPSFTEDGSSILFSSVRKGQMDIAQYEIIDDYRTWLTNTEANEFSPQSYPKKKKYFTAVRLESDGTQLLYTYSYKNKEPKVLIPNLKVGYYLWLNSRSLVSFVIGDIETLQVSDFKNKIKYPIQKNIGRSLQKMPYAMDIGSDLFSFISKEHEDPEIYAINPKTSDIEYLADPLPDSEDLTWTSDGSILMGKDDQIYKLKPGEDKDWIPIIIESVLPIKNISRLVVSPNGSKIAVVVDE
ncbi:MAG: PD40 domain-containing protein [Flavobacteriaceae bacterium]|nr:PD40 domain-containing protein [Flavobacteriaceae bacterium]